MICLLYLLKRSCMHEFFHDGAVLPFEKATIYCFFSVLSFSSTILLEFMNHDADDKIGKTVTLPITDLEEIEAVSKSEDQHVEQEVQDDTHHLKRGLKARHVGKDTQCTM